VTFRHAALTIGAVLVLGLGVYLFVEVRAQPAPIAPAIGRPAPVVTPPPAAAPVVEPPVPASPPAAARATPPPIAAPRPSLPEVAPAAPGAPLAGPKLEAAMTEANKAYDRGDYDEAKVLAGRLLAGDPTNVRMLRIMVSASCFDGDTAVAQLHYGKLPPADQEQMKVRCGRYGITFPDKP